MVKWVENVANKKRKGLNPTFKHKNRQKNIWQWNIGSLVGHFNRPCHADMMGMLLLFLAYLNMAFDYACILPIPMGPKKKRKGAIVKNIIFVSNELIIFHLIYSQVDMLIKLFIGLATRPYKWVFLVVLIQLLCFFFWKTSEPRWIFVTLLSYTMFRSF